VGLKAGGPGFVDTGHDGLEEKVRVSFGPGTSFKSEDHIQYSMEIPLIDS
jgi:hypothetical protein